MRIIGYERAEVVVVGDATTKFDFDNNVVLKKDAQNVLFDFLQQNGFEEEKVCYIPCFSLPKVSGMKLDAQALREDADENLIPFINTHPRRLVICLGNNALCAVGVSEKPEGINSSRGMRLKSKFLPRIEITASIHPYFVLSNPDENVDDFYADFRFAKRLYDGDVSDQVPFVIEDFTKPEHIQVLIDEIPQHPTIIYDLESSGLDRKRDLVVTLAFANGKKTPQGEYVGRFWGGYDRLKPLYEDHILEQFEDGFAELFNMGGKGVEFGGHNVINFDDPMVGENFYCSKSFSKYDTRLHKWTIAKYGNHGLKENVTRFLGYANYDAKVHKLVQEIADRRKRVMYESEPSNADDFYVLKRLGAEPEMASFKKAKGQGYRWPANLDKKFAAFAMIPFEDLRIYNVLDAIYSYMLWEKFEEIIDKDGLRQSLDMRHRFAKMLSQTEQRGMLVDVECNREISKLYGEVVTNADLKIKEEVFKIAPELEEFNPNSQPQVRRVLFGKPLELPHIDRESLYNYWDTKSVNRQVDQFHDRFYRGYADIADAASVGEIDLEYTTERFKSEFQKFVGSSIPLCFDAPDRKSYDNSKIYVQLKTEKIYCNGIYQPDPKAFTKGGEPSVGAQILKNLYAERPEPILQYMLMRNKAVKLKGTFIDGIHSRIDKHHILHSEFNVTGAKTGRISSRNPNGQNYPEKLRGQQIARPGYRIVGFDLSQAEIRVIAALSNDTALMDAMYSEDFHKTTASMVMGIPIEEVDKGTRSKFKTLNFGLIYGMSSFKLAVSIGVSVDEAEELMERYFDRFPLLCNWLENQKVICAQPPYCVRTAFGTRIETLNAISSDKKIQRHAERVAMNAPIQGTAGELTLWYIAEILDEWHEMYSQHPIYLVNTTHDSGSFECEEVLCERLEALIVDKIENRKAPFAPLDTVDFKCDVETTDRWYGDPDPMKALDADFGTEKQTIPWHLVLGISDDAEERAEIEEIQEMEDRYYATRS